MFLTKNIMFLMDSTSAISITNIIIMFLMDSTSIISITNIIIMLLMVPNG